MRARGYSLHQRASDGLFVVRVELGRDGAGERKQKTRYAKTERAGHTIGRALAEKYNRSHVRTTSSPTVAAYLDTWFDTYADPDTADAWRPKTREAYRHAIDAWIVPDVEVARPKDGTTTHIAGLGRHKLEDLTPLHVQDWLNNHRKAFGPRRRIALAHAALRSALARAEGVMVPMNVARGRRVPTKPKTAIRFLDGTQAQAVLDAARTHHLGALFILTLACGLRLGEVLGIQWATVDKAGRALRRGLDLTTGRLDIVQQLIVNDGRLELAPVKTVRSARSLILPDWALAAVQDHRTRQLEDRLKAGQRWVDTGLAFTTYRARGAGQVGQPLAPRNVIRALDIILDRADLAGAVTFHGLRHSATSLLIAKGVPIEQISQLLGHSTIKLTNDTYGHLLDKTAARAATLMEGLLR